MDLKHDWKALNQVLFNNQTVSARAPSLVLLEQDQRIVDGIVSNGKMFKDVGLEGVSSSPQVNKEMLDGLASKYRADQAMVFSKKILDQCVIEAASLGTNYFQQLQSLRSKVFAQMDGKKEGAIVSRRHFVLDLFGKTLTRILPRRFNALVFIDERKPPALEAPLTYRAILLSYASGQLDQFFEPDFSSLHENRLENWRNDAEEIGQYLENRYILPCVGLFIHDEDWTHCLDIANEKGHPWRHFVRHYDNGRATVYPRKTMAKALLAAQRLMVYFGRL